MGVPSPGGIYLRCGVSKMVSLGLRAFFVHRMVRRPGGEGDRLSAISGQPWATSLQQSVVSGHLNAVIHADVAAAGGYTSYVMFLRWLALDFVHFLVRLARRPDGAEEVGEGVEWRAAECNLGVFERAPSWRRSPGRHSLAPWRA